jgi:hypothetical protein
MLVAQHAVVHRKPKSCIEHNPTWHPSPDKPWPKVRIVAFDRTTSDEHCVHFRTECMGTASRFLSADPLRLALTCGDEPIERDRGLADDVWHARGHMLDEKAIDPPTFRFEDTDSNLDPCLLQSLDATLGLWVGITHANDYAPNPATRIERAIGSLLRCKDGIGTRRLLAVVVTRFERYDHRCAIERFR